MTSEAPHYVNRIEVKVKVGDDRMAASDDPVFLGLRGPSGREFRLELAKGKAWRRSEETTFVLAGPEAEDTNVKRPELNDPCSPQIDIGGLRGAYLRKGLDPIPNVRGHGEMDDRIQIDAIEVTIEAEKWDKPLRFARRDGFWLGLVCGLFMELPPTDAPA